jgi:SpoVK/Ycf46/Vps4 family AAA+-type ATPase
LEGIRLALSIYNFSHFLFRYKKLKTRLCSILNGWKESTSEDSGKFVIPCKGLLLYGPSGCGKTLIAQAISSEPGLNFFQINMYLFLIVWLLKFLARMFSLSIWEKVKSEFGVYFRRLASIHLV